MPGAFLSTATGISGRAAEAILYCNIKLHFARLYVIKLKSCQHTIKSQWILFIVFPVDRYAPLLVHYSFSTRKTLKLMVRQTILVVFQCNEIALHTAIHSIFHHSSQNCVHEVYFFHKHLPLKAEAATAKIPAARKKIPTL